MLFCNYPITVDDIIALSNNTKTIPYNIDGIISEFNISIIKKDRCRYIDEVIEVNFNDLDNKFAKIFMLDQLPIGLERFIMARALYFAIYDPNNIRTNTKMDIKSYFMFKNDLIAPDCIKINNDANKFALDLLIPIKHREKYTHQKYLGIVNIKELDNSKIKLLATYFDVTNEMITTQLYYYNREINSLKDIDNDIRWLPNY